MKNDLNECVENPFYFYRHYCYKIEEQKIVSEQDFNAGYYSIPISHRKLNYSTFSFKKLFEYLPSFLKR